MRIEKYILFSADAFIFAGFVFGFIANYYHSFLYAYITVISETYYFLMGIFLYTGVSLIIIYYVRVNTKIEKNKHLFSLITLIVMIFLGIFRLSVPETYKYVSSDGKFETGVYSFGKGSEPHECVKNRFKEYLASSDDKDVYLCRTFSRRWYDVFGWPWYLFHPRWQLPYREQNGK